VSKEDEVSTIAWGGVDQISLKHLESSFLPGHSEMNKKEKCDHDYREFTEVKEKGKDYLGRRTVLCVKCYGEAPEDIAMHLMLGRKKIVVVGEIRLEKKIAKSNDLR